MDNYVQDLIIVRGLPGAGKSTLAREIAKCGYLHFENDMFLESEEGYVYTAEAQMNARILCLKGTKDALLAGKRVVVSNVFARVVHMEQYLKLTDSIQVIECGGRYGSVHAVPDAILASMAANWEPYEGALRIGA